MSIQRYRSMLVSVVTTILDAGLFAICTLLLASGTAWLIARWVCGAIGAASNFALNRRWVFQRSPNGIWSQVGRYTITAP
jgi:putative flippase GtrA